MPDWCDKNKVQKALTKRKKRTPAQRNHDDFERKAVQAEKTKWYNNAFKIATQTYYDNLHGPNAGKSGYGVRSVVDTVNDLYLDEEGDRKIKYQSVANYVTNKLQGKSPVKNGRSEVVPKQFTKALAIHATMQQVTAGGGEASGKGMREVIEAMTDGTEWEGKFDAKYAWRRTRSEHPELFIPAKAKNHEDRRMEWLTAQNINDWMDGAKDYLIKHNFVINEPGFICK